MRFARVIGARSVHRNAREVTNAMIQLENKLGQDATDREVADELRYPDGILPYSERCPGSKLFSYMKNSGTGEPGVQSNTPNPMDQIQNVTFNVAWQQRLRPCRSVNRLVFVSVLRRRAQPKRNWRSARRGRIPRQPNPQSEWLLDCAAN